MSEQKYPNREASRGTLHASSRETPWAEVTLAVRRKTTNHTPKASEDVADWKRETPRFGNPASR